MRSLGLDVGSHTIGVAVSDALDITAQGMETVRRKNLAYDIEKIKDYVVRYDIETFVVGHPKNMDGSLGAQAKMSEEFADMLKEHFPERKIVLWDERLTTQAAHRMLIDADVKRKGRKKVVDKIAAVLILQGYLDRIKNDEISNAKG